jgi:hypothetical protein
MERKASVSLVPVRVRLRARMITSTAPSARGSGAGRKIEIELKTSVHKVGAAIAKWIKAFNDERLRNSSPSGGAAMHRLFKAAALAIRAGAV